SDLLDRCVNLHVALGAVANDTRGCGLELYERSQCRRCLSLGTRLECIACEYEGDDDDYRLVVHVRHDAAGKEEARRNGCQHGIQECRARTYGNQGVHVCRMMAEGCPGARVEVSPGPCHDAERHEQESPGDRSARN